MKPETQYKLLVKVATADRAAGILARIAGAQQVKTAASDALITAGAGLGGAALGAGAGYALSGLSPAMKKKKLYRILAALGGGAVGGAGAALGTNALLKNRAANAFKNKNGIEKKWFEDMGNYAAKSVAEGKMNSTGLNSMLAYMPPEMREQVLNEMIPAAKEQYLAEHQGYVGDPRNFYSSAK